MDWYEQTFGSCPHGYIKPYCGQCAGDKARAAKEEQQLKRELNERSGLKDTVRRQSAALDDAYAQIRNLQRRTGRR